MGRVQKVSSKLDRHQGIGTISHQYLFISFLRQLRWWPCPARTGPCVLGIGRGRATAAATTRSRSRGSTLFGLTSFGEVPAFLTSAWLVFESFGLIESLFTGGEEILVIA